jgi:hypothetical protein
LTKIFYFAGHKKYFDVDVARNQDAMVMCLAPAEPFRRDLLSLTGGEV